MRLPRRAHATPIRAAARGGRGRAPVLCPLLLALGAAGCAGDGGRAVDGGCAGDPGADRPAPAFDARGYRTEYLGPGRDAPPPEDLREIRLALFCPADENHPDWGDAWRGAVLAAEEANAGGGCLGLPVRLASAWSENPWGTGVSGLVKLVYREGVLALIGGVDGATTPLAEQIAVKARLPLLSPGCTDPSVNLTNVAWMFTLLPTDDRNGAALADTVLARRGGGSWSAIGTTDRDARVAWREFRAAAARRNAPAPALHLVLPPAAPDYGRAAADLAKSGARAIVLFAAARDAARLVKALRAVGYEGEIAGGAPLGRRPFLEEAGEAAEGVVFPLLFDPAAPGAAPFVHAYEARWGTPPDYLAAHAYDAVRLAIDATARAGPNRARIRDALAGIETWRGAAGPLAWDATGRNTRPIVMGVWRSGCVARL